MRRALALGLLLLALLPPASAQSPSILPPGPYQERLVLVSVNADPDTQEVDRLNQVRYDLTIDDMSVDAQQGSSVIFHNIDLTVQKNESAYPGWNAFLGQTFFSPSYGGNRWQTFLVVQAPATIKSQFMKVVVTATLSSTTGQVVTDSTEVATRVRPFTIADVDLRAAPREAGPFEQVQFPVTISNAGLYPDTFLISATAPEHWYTSVQPKLTLFPGETREVTVDVITPSTRVFVPQETGIILVQVRSTLDPNLVYERAAVVNLQGFFFPEYWAPLLVLGAVLVGAVAKRTAEGGRRSAKEQGQPVPPRFTPAQQVMLADLKRRDPQRYQALVGKQRALHRARLHAFTALRGRRLEVERALVERQHVQARDAKLRERARLQEEAERQRAFEARKAELERELGRRRAEEERLRRAQEQRAEREAARRARLEAPTRRRQERERREAERRLRAELARKRRLLQVEQRKRRIDLERRARLLGRRKRDLERRAGRKAGKGGKGRGKGGPPEE